MKTLVTISLILSLACAGQMPALDKMANAATMLCDGMEMYEKYQPQLEMIKSLIAQKDYMTALFYAKGMYVDAQNNGDAKMVEDLIPLLATLQTLASKAPLKVVKPEPGLKAL